MKHSNQKEMKKKENNDLPMEIKTFKKIKQMLSSEDEELVRLGYEILCHHEKDSDRVELIVLSYINKKFIPNFVKGKLEIQTALFPYNNFYTSTPSWRDTKINPLYTIKKENSKVINLKNKNQQK